MKKNHLIDRINRMLTSLTGRDFFETDKAQEIHNHYFSQGHRNASALHLPQDALNRVRENFLLVQQALAPEHIDDFEIVGEFEKGKLIDISSAYIPADQNQAPVYNILDPETATRLITAFKDIAAECVSDSYAIHAYGKNRTGIAGWHTDGQSELVGILPLNDSPLTTQFKGVLGPLPAPQHAIIFTGDEEHSPPETQRPTIHIIDHS